MNSKLNIPLCTVTMLLASYILGNRASMIRAHLHEDVLLACQGAYTGDFILEFLVITWQRSDNDAVVHSFYHERDQPQYQEEEFRGRTQLFPGDFHKGNASLLLKDVRESDAGSYTCHYIMYDKDAYTPQHLVLLVQSKDNLMVFPPDLHGKDNLMVFPPDLHDWKWMANSPDLHENNRRSWSWRLCLLPVPLIIAAGVLIMFIKFRNYQKWSMPPEDQEALLGSSPNLCGAIESYRRKVLSTIERCCKSAFNEEGSEEEKDDCLPRIFHTMSGEMLHECSDKEKPHMGFAFKQKEGTVQSEDLFTEKTLELISERMLISGDAGIGKSCFLKGLLKQWASGQKDLCYTCVIYMPFTELNAIEAQTSVRRLLESKCPELSPVLTELLVKEKILIILDGLDEFNHDLKDSSPPPDNTCDIDTPLDISTLITKVIYKELLPDTHVLVTSRLSYVCKIKESFTSAFRLEAFTEDQVKEYCEKFMPGNHISDSILDFIRKHNLSSLVSIPLLSSTLCQLYQKGDHSQDEGSLTTSSRLMFSLLQLSMKATLTETGHIDQIMPEKSDVPESIQNTIHQLCKMSYDNLINGVQEIKRKDLEVNNNLISGVLKTETKVPVNCSETDVLLKNLSEFFFKRDTKEDTFEYRHASIRDMFAALYCVMQIQEEKELEIFLNAFVFGEMLQDLKVPLLAKITSDHWKRFLNFIRFFFGLLSYKNNSLLSQPLSLSKDIKEFLKQWFQAWIEKSPQKMKFFNFLHCAFELQDPDLREDISHSIKNVNLFNIPLNSLDLKALCYCCHNSLLEAMDLRLCELRDAALEELQILIRMCKDVMLSSNKLSEKSGEILGSLLGDEKCAIEKLSLGTNFLGDSGTKHIFKGLENNKSLKFLSLTGNNISDLGTVSMAQSLKNNKTLKELRLCMNFFEHDGIININKLKRDRPDLKIVTRIAEDEEVLRYTEEKVKGLLSRGSNQYKMTWLVQLLQKVLKDLNDDENTHSCVENTVKERVQILKNNISQVLGRYETHQSTLKV